MGFKKFILGFIITVALLIFISTIYLNIPLQPSIIFGFLIVASVIGLLFALSKKGVHHGHVISVLGFGILVVFGSIISGAIDIPGQDMVKKTFSLPPQTVTLFLLAMAGGVFMMFAGMYVTVRKFGGKNR